MSRLGSSFKKATGKDASKLSTLMEIDAVAEKALGHPLRVSRNPSNILSWHKVIPVSSGSKHIDNFIDDEDDGLGLPKGIANAVKISAKYLPFISLLGGSIAYGLKGEGATSALLAYCSIFYAGAYCNPEFNLSNENDLGLDHKKHGFSEEQYTSAQEIFRKSI